MDSPARVAERDPSSARDLFGSELRRLRERGGLSQRRLAAIVMHSRTLIEHVELGERWAPRELAVRSDEALNGEGILTRIWPLVEAERRAAREVLSGVRLSDLRVLVMRLAVLTGTDLTSLGVADDSSSSDG